jgi:hypothetical protein
MKVENGVFEVIRDDREIPRAVRHERNAGLRLLRFKSVETLVDFPNIAALEVFVWPLDNFGPLLSLGRLRKLHVTHFPKVHSLEALAQLTKLEDLLLTTLPSWYNKSQNVESLRPLAALLKLRKLNLAGVLAEDKDLSPLHGLKSLREVFVPNIYPQEELARLAGQLPKVRRDWFLNPFVRMDEVECKKCGNTKVMLSGSDIRPRVICPTCQEKKFNACVRRSEDVASAAGRTRALQRTGQVLLCSHGGSWESSPRVLPPGR